MKKRAWLGHIVCPHCGDECRGADLEDTSPEEIAVHGDVLELTCCECHRGYVAVTKVERTFLCTVKTDEEVIQGALDCLPAGTDSARHYLLLALSVGQVEDFDLETWDLECADLFTSLVLDHRCDVPAARSLYEAARRLGERAAARAGAAP